MKMSPFSAPFFWGTRTREAAAPKASGCFMGGTCAVREEPGKQKARSCRAQELARSSAQENVRPKKRFTQLNENRDEEYTHESTRRVKGQQALRGKGSPALNDRNERPVG
jgi:hypothetical protein